MLETDRLTLRPYERSDLDVMGQILGDSKTMQFWPQPFDPKAVSDWVNRSLDSYLSHGFGRWVVVLKKDDCVIGDCGILKIEVNGTIENDLGYIIHHPWWRQGYASEAARACMDYGFRQLGLQRLVANMTEDHLGSRAVAEKLGMRLESRFRNSRNGMKWTVLYSITDGQWQ
jgi:ribosomal-protein-alanine N-acetyltransferase